MNGTAREYGLRRIGSAGELDELQTGNPFPSLNNQRNALDENPDGSVDIFFGPEAPQGKEANWIETVPGKSWFVILRLYGPLEPWFDKTWQPGEIERID